MPRSRWPGSATRPSSGPDVPLEQDQVVEAAIGILDTWGLADLSMRRLANALGVKAGALYWHVDNKQTLLALVADRILAQPPPGAGEGVLPELERWAAGLRCRLLQHRDGAELVASALASGLCRADPAAEAATLLQRAGLDAVGARRGGRALLHLVLGHVMEEQNIATLLRLGVRPDGPPTDEAGFGFAVHALVVGLMLDVKE